MDFILHSDLAVCILTGIVLGVTTIITSSYFYPSKSKGSVTRLDQTENHNADDESIYHEYNCTSSKSLEPSELDPIVVEKLCEDLARRLPENISVSDTDIKNAVIESLINPESLDEINIAGVLGWVVFLVFFGIAYYLINNVTDGDFHQILKGFFPREFKVFGL